ncbi:MAG TPA: enolase C-terminal domain-like protein [Burkholderiales bacterium]|nr:enolase C-terminal domain-like protein [Burkholderiales bacterium]
MNDPLASRAVQARGDRDAAPLRIARVEAIPVALPLTKPVVMAGERIEHAYNLLVRVEAENGLAGWGEAASAPLMTGDVLPGMVAAVNAHLAPLVIGQDALRRAELAQRCARAMLHNTGAKCAVDMAINDLVGHHLRVSLADLFGGALREILQPMYLLGNPKVEDDIAEAKSKLKEGWSFFKLKIGIKPPLEEARAAIEIRRELGNEVALCADANMGMTFANARLFAEHAQEANLLFMEQPLHSDDVDGMAALARVSPIPLNGDESIGNVASLLALHRSGAIQGANIKTIKMGGITPAVQAMSVCGALGLSINLAGKVAESSIAAAAIAQLGGVAPNLDWGINITSHYLAEDVTDAPLRIERGTVHRPRGPGLGVAVSEARVNRLRLK